MTPETFFENFALLADEPNGVPLLRALILQLAVQGKLVPQDPTDEPASVLLERIREERARQNGQQKLLDAETQSISSKLHLYAVPSGWEWAKLGDVVLSITGGGTPSKNNPQYWNGSISWASVKDLKTKYLRTTIDSITERGLQESSTNLIPKGRIIVCTRMGLGKIAINMVDMAINQDLKALHLSKFFDEDYFYNFYLTLDIVGKGMTVSGIRQSELLSLSIPVPPLAEQRRIVAKVDQLMALCDELETRQQQRRAARTHLNNATLDQLLAAREPDEFAAHWQRLRDNFDLLYDTPETIGKLRQAILQLAVQGKLVPQDPTDEPASVLLERIRAEKARLIAEGKLKKEEFLSTANNEDLLQLPIGWMWCRIGDFATIRGGKRLPLGRTMTSEPTSHIYIRVSDMKNGTIDDTDLHYIDEETYQEIKRYIIGKDDLYLTIVGATIGKLGLVPEKFDLMNLTENAARISMYYVDKYFLKHAMNSLLIQEQFFDKTNQLGVPKLALKRVASVLFPLPPLAEQRRIVVKVEQIMALCDELEAQLKDAQARSAALLEAVVRQVLADGVTAA